MRRNEKKKRHCVQCLDENATVMLVMEPGPDGKYWILCGDCWSRKK